MTTRDTNEICELTSADLDLVTGGLADEIIGGMKVASTMAALSFLYCYGHTITHPADPWG